MATATGGPEDPAPRTRRFALALVALASVAAALRLWRIGWGLADGLVFGDEKLYWAFALQDFLPSFDRGMRPATPLTYPTLFHLFAGGLGSLGHAIGLIDATADTSQRLTLILIGRIVSAAFGVLSVVLVGIVGRRAYSERSGLAAAALLAVAPLEVLQAHVVSVDLLMTCCGVATLWAALELERRATLRAAFAGGAAAGLGFAAKYTGLAYLVAPGWAALEVAWRMRSPARIAALGIAILLGALVALSAGCPQCVLRSDLMLAAMSVHRNFERFYAYAATNNHLTRALGWYGKPYLYEIVASLPWGLGWPLYLVGVLGILRALRTRTPPDRLILVLLATYFAVMGFSKITWPRYLLPIYPGIALLAGRWIADGPGRARPRAVVFAAVFAYTLALTASEVRRFSWDQQHALVDRLRADLLPHAAPDRKPTVAFPWFVGDYFNLDELLRRGGMQPVRVDTGRWLVDRPDAFVLPEWEAIAAQRDGRGAAEASEIAGLDSGAAGYRRVAQWRSRYLQEGLYTWLDPAFAGDLWQGETGFTLYVRDDLLAADAPSSAAARALGARPRD